MDMNKITEIAKRESNINPFLWRMLDLIRDSNLDKFVLQSAGFIGSDDNRAELEDFVRQLREAEITEFILTDNSSGLMRTLAAFDEVGLKIVKPCKVAWVTHWHVFVEEQGLIISVQEE